jgi:hypothetical protein
MLTVYVYRKKEYGNKNGVALPVFTKLIKNEAQTIGLYLPAYEKNYYWEIRTPDNRIAMSSLVEKSAT